MKRLLILFIAILFVAVGCGTSDSDATNSSGNNDGEVSQGNEGTGETLPTKEDLDNKVVEDISSLLEQLEFTAEMDMNNDKATFLMELKNNAEEKMDLGFSSGQQFEIVVRDANSDKEVFRYSEGMMFTEALEFKEIKPNESLTWTYEWNFEGKEGKVEQGDYVATVTLLPMSLNEVPIEANPFVQEVSFGMGANHSGDVESTDQNSGVGTTTSNSNNAFRNVEVTGEDGSYVVTGEGRVFEAQFSYHVEDGHNILVEETFVQLNEGAPSWSDFEIKVELPEEKLPINGTLTIVLFERSAKDGQPTNELIIPLEQFPGK